MSPSPGQELARVDKELRAFWSSPPAPGETPKSRACTRNLIVVTGTAELATKWVPIVDDVLRVIPARAIVVARDPGGKDSLDATTTAVCSPGDTGAPSICSERVTLHASGAVCARLASCVRTLCATDVPTTLVWLERVHAEDEVFVPLAADADRIVLDSARGSLADLACLAHWAGGRDAAERPGIADLAWTRLAPWQELCARMFDEPRLRELPARITRVEIAQASAVGTPLAPEGGLLLAWLATRLQWQTTSVEGELSLLGLDEKAVAIQLRAVGDSRMAPGALLSVQIEAAAGELAVAGKIKREHGQADAATWSLEVKCRGETRRIEQCVRLRASELAPLLQRTLHRPAHDPALVDSLAWADRLLGEVLTFA